MRDDHLLRLVWCADPQISPDGSRVAFTRVHVDAEADEYRTAIWLAEVPVAGRAPGAPRALTTGHYDIQPRWSPDGGRLAFIRKTEPKKPGQLFVLSMSGGEPVKLTDLAKGASEPAWSPDGEQIAFLSGTNPALDDPEKEKTKPKNEPGRVVTRAEFRWNDEGFTDFEHLDHVWVVGAEGGPPRQLTRGDFKEMSPAWSRDGKWIHFLSDRRLEPYYEQEDVDLFAVSPDLAAPTDGDALKTVVDIRGPIYAYVEGDDGRVAAIGGLRDGTFRSYDQPELLLFEGPWPRKQAARLTVKHDLEMGQQVASDQHPPRGGGAQPLALGPDGSVFAVANQHGSCMLVRVTPAGVEELTPRGRDVVCGSVTRDGRRVALTVGDVTTPGDLYVFDVSTSALIRIWGPNDALLAEQPLGQVEEFWCDAFDGTKIQGWIVKPADFDPKRKYPLILEIHGGPHIPYGFGFFHEFRVLAAAGYVVLYTNPRGSTSYGHAFANLIQYRYPGDDLRDLMTAVDEVIARGYVDPSRMGVTGGSGGGLLTNWVVTHTDRFACAITQRCVADWASMYYSSDFALFTPTWFHKPPFEGIQEYLERSPVMFASRITTPLMVIHSEDDWRTPIGQGEAMFRAMKQQKKPTVMVRFPGESHELSRSGTPSRRVQRLEHIRRWFDFWLLGREAREYGLEKAEPARAQAAK